MFKKTGLGLTAAAILLGSTAYVALAQTTPPPAPPATQAAPAQTSRPDWRVLRMQEQFDTRLAAAKERLKLTADQDKLWGPVETAIRDGFTKQAGMMGTFRQAAPADPIDRLRRHAELMAGRADSMRKLADAAAPLWASLSDEQKKSLPRFIGGMQREGGRGMDREMDRDWGRGMREWRGQRERDGMGQRGDMGPRGRSSDEGRGMGRGFGPQGERGFGSQDRFGDRDSGRMDRRWREGRSEDRGQEPSGRGRDDYRGQAPDDGGWGRGRGEGPRGRDGESPRGRE